MNEQLGNSENDFLWKLLANPADSSHSYVHSLQGLVDDFPQSGVLRALLVSNGGDQHLKHAAAYFTPHTLYKIVNDAGSLPSVSAGQVVYNEGASAAEHTDTETATEASAETNYFHAPAEQDIAHIADERVEDENVITDEVYEEQQDIADIIPAAIEVAEEPATGQEETFKVEYFHQDIEDEIYDEIVGIEDISLEQAATVDTEAADEEQEDISVETDTDSDAGQNNYFVFESSSSENREEVAPREEANQNVSRYNDEKMPYTFMWWLDKTRKEHADIYQPYVSNNKPVVTQSVKPERPDELQQQYYENIFNINSIDELDKSTATQPATAHTERKEDKIIERFIQEEPQIKHPNMVKLDSENKAKKSSEDRDELVTETLAKIYTEQMLYHKALLTYKKLMLKFPEKSLYFASQIEQLENKIN